MWYRDFDVHMHWKVARDMREASNAAKYALGVVSWKVSSGVREVCGI